MSDLTLRWSSTVDCPRKAIYGATREPDRDWSDREARIMYRGRSLGADYVAWLKAKYGPNAVWREVKVKWAFGVGHIDAFLRPTKTAIEVLSSAWANDEMVQRKLMQLVGYMEAYPRAHNGCLIVLNPSDFSESRWPVAKDTDTYRALVERLNDRLYELHAWKNTGKLPDRVCRKPTDAFGHFCRHADTCFADWEPPEPVSVLNDPEAIKLAAALAHAKADERVAASVATGKEEARKAIEQQLAALDGVDGVSGDIRIGPFKVKRVHVRRSPSIDWKKATVAGALNVEAFAEYMKPGADYWTTAIERVDDGAVVPDFGEEAPWTDEDLAAGVRHS